MSSMDTFPSAADLLPGDPGYAEETERLAAQTDELEKRLSPEDRLRVMAMVAIHDRRAPFEEKVRAAFTLNSLNARSADAAPEPEPVQSEPLTPDDLTPALKSGIDQMAADHMATLRATGQSDFDRLDALRPMSRTKL